MAQLIMEILDSKDLIGKKFPVWDGQRGKNAAWVEQITYISKYGIACFPGSMVLIKFGVTSYIADGSAGADDDQHREQVIRELLTEGYNLNSTNMQFSCVISKKLKMDIKQNGLNKKLIY